MAIWPLLGKAAVTAFKYAFVYVAGRLLEKGGWSGSAWREWQPIPRAPQPTPGAAIPVVFGTRWAKTSSVVWSGDLLIEPEGDREKYSLGMHLAICHTPIDELVEIKAEQITLWNDGSSANETIAIDKPGAFGGLDGEGGVVGDVDLLFGAVDQPANAYLTAQLGDVPAFRGVVSVVANQVYLTTTSSIKPWAFLVRMQDAGLLAGTAVIGDDINPARILELALTNTAWGLGVPAAELDTASWSTAWSALAAEGFGLSLIWDTARPVGDLIANILTHIMGVLYTDLETGKLVVKLIRQDYSAPALLHLDESSVVEITEFSRPSLSELVNTVTVHYTDRDDNPQSITLHNTGLLAQMGGRVVAQDIHYDAVVEGALANQIAARDLYNSSTPLASLVLTGNRSLLSLRLGDAFRLSWIRYGLDEDIFRVTWIDYGDLSEGSVHVHATEDLRGLDAPLYSAPDTEWVDPISDPAPSANRWYYEGPYYLLYRTWGAYAGTWSLIQANVGGNGGIGMLLVRRPSADSAQYRLMTQGPDDADYVDRNVAIYSPTGTLSLDVEKEITTNTVITNLTGGGYEVTVGAYCLIETATPAQAELGEVTAYNAATGAITIKRGVLDTVPQEHAATARIWFSDSFASLGSGWDGQYYTLSDTIDAKALTITSKGTLAISDAPADDVTMDGRFHRPYPPGKFRINAEYWPDFITGDLAVTWAHRNRLTQQTPTGPYIAQDADSIAFEAGTTYTLRIYDENGDLAHTASGLTGDEYVDYTVADEITDRGDGRPNESLRIELWSVRDGLASWQQQEHLIEECRGYGMFYGAYYGE